MMRAREYGEFSADICTRSIAEPQPTRVQFELTYRCNIHCVHCYTDPFNTPADIRRELDIDAVVRILDELAAAGVLWLTLTGGEAVVHPQFARIYKEAKRRGFLISLYSNGTTVSESLADFLADDPPFTIDVSCHAATRDTFDRFTQVPGSFDLFTRGIRRLLDRGLPVSMKTKGMTVNRHELQQIQAFVEGLGLEFHLFTTIQPRLDGDLSSIQYRLSPEEIIDLELQPADTTPAHGECEAEANAAILSAPPDDRLFRCGCGTNSCTISPYGIVRACTHTTWPSYDLKTYSFAEAFGRVVADIRSARYTGESPCRGCTVYTLCTKNPAMAVHEAGSMEAPVAHHCSVAFGKAARLSGDRRDPPVRLRGGATPD